MKFLKLKIFIVLMIGFAFMGSTINRASRSNKYFGRIDSWTVALAGNGDVDTSSTIERFPYRMCAKITVPYSVALSITGDTLFHDIDGTNITSGAHRGTLDTLYTSDTTTVALVDTELVDLSGTLSGSFEATTRYDYRYQARVVSNSDTFNVLCTAYGSLDGTNWFLADTIYNIAASFTGDTTFTGTFDLNGQNWPYVQQRWKDSAGEAADSSYTITHKLYIPKN